MRPRHGQLRAKNRHPAPPLPDPAQLCLEVRPLGCSGKRSVRDPAHPGPGALGKAFLPGIPVAEHGEVLRTLALEQHSFVGHIGLHVRVLVLVVSQDRGHHRHPGIQEAATSEVSKLPGGQLEDHRVLRAQLLEEAQGAHGDVSAQPGAGMAGEQTEMRGCGGGGFSLRAGDRHEGIRAQAQEQAQVRFHGNPPLASQGQERARGRHRRVLDDQLRVAEVLLVVTAEHGPHAQGCELRQHRREHPGVLPVVGHGHPGPPAGQKAGAGQASAVQTQPHDRDLEARQLRQGGAQRGIPSCFDRPGTLPAAGPSSSRTSSRGPGL